MTKMLSRFMLAALLALASTSLSAADKPAADEPYRSPGKPEHPLKVEFDVEGKPAVGVAMPIGIRVSAPGFEIRDVRVDIEASTGLVVESMAQQYLQKMTADDAEQWTFQVTPAAEGWQEVRVQVSAWQGDALWTREVRRDIPVGEVEEKPYHMSNARIIEAADGTVERRGSARQEVRRQQ